MPLGHASNAYIGLLDSDETLPAFGNISTPWTWRFHYDVQSPATDPGSVRSSEFSSICFNRYCGKFVGIFGKSNSGITQGRG
ncbi:hypothetical protein Y032_0038g3560 [Ancylostoma ceylanicum]|uniref:Uncharacterized protein n=1 Tax=Ancylostoma ceylanicum TaxID=53326 RepID=A0A016UI03_9BILA|nr:hypothetical protein Y032_0038g3560 [Ancylostoma ceylanicum]